MNEKEIKILKYMLGKKEVTSRELERKLNLRQPEVSLAMKDLSIRGWVAFNKIKKDGKGRPFHNYYLKVTKEEIIKQLNREIDEKIKQLEETKKKIKKMLG